MRPGHTLRTGTLRRLPPSRRVMEASWMGHAIIEGLLIDCKSQKERAG
jgi:hypothetical protein